MRCARAASLELDPLARLLEPIDTSTLARPARPADAAAGFAAALHRSELDVEHLEFATARGLLVTIASSKTR